MERPEGCQTVIDKFARGAQTRVTPSSPASPSCSFLPVPGYVASDFLERALMRTEHQKLSSGSINTIRIPLACDFLRCLTIVSSIDDITQFTESDFSEVSKIFKS